MNWETLLCLGDSITIGSRSYLGYPEYCGAHLEEKTAKNWNVINCAVAGFTTIDLVRHIDQNWSNLKNLKPEVVSIMVGTNDLKAETSIKNFNIAYAQLVVKAKLLVNSKYVILNKIPLLQDGVMLPYNSEMNELSKHFNDIIQEIAQTNQLILNEMPESPDCFYDGVHLNDSGSEKWGNHLAQKILNLRHA